MKHLSARTILVLVLLLSMSSTLYAQEAALASSAVNSSKALVRYILEKFGSKGALSLEQFGGRTAVRQVMQKAETQGGQALVKKVTLYGERYGISALRAVKSSPKTIIAALDTLPTENISVAIGAINRNAKAMPNLIKRYGPDVLKAEVKNPGVGIRFAKDLGKPGIAIANKLNTKQAIVLARHLDEIKVLPISKKTQLLTALSRWGEKAVTFLEKHPKFMITAASVPTLLYAIHAATTPTTRTDANGNPIVVAPSLTDRFGRWASGVITRPLSLLFYLLGAILVLYTGGYFGLKLRAHFKSMNRKNQPQKDSLKN